MIRHLRTAVLIGTLFSVAWFAGTRLGVVLGNRAPVKVSSHGPNTPPRDPRIVRGGSPCLGMLPLDKMSCYRSLFVRQITASGIERAMDTLAALARVDSDVERDTHMYAHGIGIDAFELHPDLGAVFSHCSAAFSSGCYHGVMQAYFQSQHTIDSGVVRATCRPYEAIQGSRWIDFQCLHGMGHGLDMTFDHELPRALKACDLLAEEWQRHSCYGGVFMENITQVTNPHDAAGMLSHEGQRGGGMQMASDMPMGRPAQTSGGGTKGPGVGARATHRWRPYDKHDLQYPCSAEPKRYRAECYGMQTALILYLKNGDIAGTARACDRAPREFRSECYQSLGRDISGIAGYKDPAALRLCGYSSRAYRASCYIGAAQTFVNEETRPEPGFALCGAVSVAKDRRACFASVGVELITLATEPRDRERMCALPVAADAAACREGAELTAPTKTPGT